jgi:ribosomal protein L7Ae-like RNA K-turn-binding protein
MLPTEIIGLLGLAQRAGKIIIGSTAVSREIRRTSEAMLLFFAVDFSSATKERMLAHAATRPRIVEIGTMEEWGKFFGREKVGVMAIADRNFAAGILQKLKS